MARRKRQASSRWRWQAALVVVIALAAIAGVAGDWQPEQAWDRFFGPDQDRSEHTSSAWVNTGVLNVRESPSTDSGILATGAYGDEVIVVGDSEGPFLPVKVDGVQGWMAEDYLSLNSDLPPLAESIGLLPLATSAAEPTAIPAPPEPVEAEPTAVPQRGERWIEIDRSSASVTLHDGEVIVAVFAARIGRDPSADGFYSTAIGTYSVYSMNKGLSFTPFAENTYLTDWVGFDPERKNGIHSPVRDADGVEKAWQNQTTLGCVRLGADEAATLFAFAEIGMRVEVGD